jgi:hypothetical protein
VARHGPPAAVGLLDDEQAEHFLTFARQAAAEQVNLAFVRESQFPGHGGSS